MDSDVIELNSIKWYISSKSMYNKTHMLFSQQKTEHIISQTNEIHVFQLFNLHLLHLLLSLTSVNFLSSVIQ